MTDPSGLHPSILSHVSVVTNNYQRVWVLELVRLGGWSGLDALVRGLAGRRSRIESTAVRKIPVCVRP